MEKWIGYILIFFGLCIVLYTGYNGFQVFIGKSEPIRVFISEPVSTEISQLPTQPQGISPDIIKSLQPMLNSLINQSMGPNMEKPINITIHFLILGFFVNIGFRIASVGAMLVRSITYKIKEVVSEQTIRQ